LKASAHLNLNHITEALKKELAVPACPTFHYGPYL
jgi:hypothetical protein